MISSLKRKGIFKVPSNLDVNDYLILNKIHTLSTDERSKAVEMRRLQTILQVDENYFLNTIRQLEKRKLIQIGFYQRNTLLHIVNWTEKYANSQDFYVSLTKKGKAELTAW